MLATDLRQDVVRHASIRLSDGARGRCRAQRASRARTAAKRRAHPRQPAGRAGKPQPWNSPPKCCSRASSTQSKPGCRCSMRPHVTEADLAEGARRIRSRAPADLRLCAGRRAGRDPVTAACRHRAHRPAAIPQARNGDGSRRSGLEGRARGLVRRRLSGKSPVYDGARFSAGHIVDGPALVEHATTTIKIAPDWRACVDEIGNLLMWRHEQTLDEAIARLQERQG